jgi:hypothetical protein
VIKQKTVGIAIAVIVKKNCLRGVGTVIEAIFRSSFSESRDTVGRFSIIYIKQLTS